MRRPRRRVSPPLPPCPFHHVDALGEREPQGFDEGASPETREASSTRDAAGGQVLLEDRRHLVGEPPSEILRVQTQQGAEHTSRDRLPGVIWFAADHQVFSMVTSPSSRPRRNRLRSRRISATSTSRPRSLSR